MGKVILKIKDMCFAYNNDLIFDKINLWVQKGSIFGVVGKNGSGKSTLFNLITGILSPDKGSIEVAGKSKNKLMAFLPERPYYHPNFRLKEYLFYLAKISSVEIDVKEINEIIDRVYLSKHRNQLIKNFSKGMLQRVGIAQVLLHKSELIILDEPMSGLDLLGQKLIRKIIRELNERDKTVIISSHNLYEIERICNNVALVYNKKIKILDGESKRKIERYYFNLDAEEDKLVPLLMELDIDYKDEILIVPADDNYYFKVLKFIYENKIKIKSLESTYKSIEDIVLEYMGGGRE